MPIGPAKDIKLLLRRAMPRGFYDAACLYRKSLNPSGVNWLSRGLRGAEMLFPSRRREIFTLSPHSLLMWSPQCFALTSVGLTLYRVLINTFLFPCIFFYNSVMM